MSWPWHPTGHCHSSCLPVHRLEGSISTSLCEWSWDACSHWDHHHQLARWHQGGSLSLMSLLATPWDPHYWRWPCPPWKSPHCSPIRKGENTTPTTPVPSRNHEVPVAHAWMYLLAWYKQSHWRSCSSMWDLHLVPSPKCCSTPHSYANSIPPMADVHLRHLYPGRSWLHHMWWLLLKDDPCLTSSIWLEQHHQSHLIAQGNVLRPWNPRNPSLWQRSSIHECPVCQVLHLLGYHPWDLKPSLSTIKWICRGMCRISETCTPTC